MNLVVPVPESIDKQTNRVFWTWFLLIKLNGGGAGHKPTFLALSKYEVIADIISNVRIEYSSHELNSVRIFGVGAITKQ